MKLNQLLIIASIINLSFYVFLAFVIGWWTLLAIPLLHLAFYRWNYRMITRGLNNGTITP